MSDSVSGRVSPEDLEAMAAIPSCGCGAPSTWMAVTGAGEYGCEECAAIVYLWVARRVESATIEADAYAITEMADTVLNNLNFERGAREAAKCVRARPRLYSPPTPTQEGT